MKVYLIAVIMSWVSVGGGTSLQVVEMPDMATCESIAEAIRAEDGWTAVQRSRRTFKIDATYTKCLVVEE